MHILALIVNLVPYHVSRWSAVASTGHQVTLVQRRASDPFAVLGASAADAPFQIHTLIEPQSGSPSWYHQILACFDRVDPGVVVVSGYSFPEGLAALLAARERRLPVVVCSESNWHDARRAPLTEAVKTRILSQAQAALVGAEPQAGYLEQLGLLPSSIFRGYNAVDNDHFATASHWRSNEIQARASLGLPSRYLLAVSRFTPKKNLATLIRGYALWRQQRSPTDPDLELLILGDGPLRPALEEQIQLLGLQRMVHLPGPCAYTDLPSRYAFAEGFIHASTVEQWGLVVNEAMAAGLPVLVSSACGCAPQLVQPGINGLRFDPSSPAAIADAIHWLACMDPQRRRLLGQASVRLVSGFGPEAFAAGLTAAAEHACQQPYKSMQRLDRWLLSRLMQRADSDA